MVLLFLLSKTNDMQWRAEGLGCLGPTRFWMPPNKSFYFFMSSTKIFLHSCSKNFFDNSSSKNSDDLVSFPIFSYFFQQILLIFYDLSLGCPPYRGCRAFDFFLLFLTIFLHYS